MTGYGSVATLGHAVLFGAGAYGTFGASMQGGLADPLLLLAIGALCGALACLVSGR